MNDNFSLHYDADEQRHLRRIPEIMPAASTVYRERPKMPEENFEVTATRLSTITQNVVKRRERQIARELLELLDTGSEEELAGYIAKLQGPAPQIVNPVVENAVPEPIDLEDTPDEEELPPVRHMNDFDEGVTLARMGSARRGVHGYVSPFAKE